MESTHGATGLGPSDIGVTAIVLTKNEELAIGACLKALSDFVQIIVVDSHSTDRTVEISAKAGAEVVSFQWDGQFPKKKQWSLSLDRIRSEWILLLDADEIVTTELATEIREVVTNRPSIDNIVAYDVPLAYVFAGRELRHGHVVKKRSLLRRNMASFPDVGDQQLPGITEVEGHYQPEVRGRVGTLTHKLKHQDPDPLGSWVDRHNRYSDWEAHLRRSSEIEHKVRAARSRQGRFFRLVPFKPLVFFIYSYILRLGLLDGRPGFDYAYALTFYYWLTGAKERELQRSAKE